MLQLVLLAGLCALAQLQESPEIRGTVIAGATVTLSESVFKEPGIHTRVIGTVVTDARGQFSFKPGHYGNCYVEAGMAGTLSQRVRRPQSRTRV